MRKANISHLYADAKRVQELMERRKKVEELKKRILNQRKKLQAKKSLKTSVRLQLNRLQQKHEQAKRVLEKVESQIQKARTGKPPLKPEKQKARALKLGTTGAEARAIPLPKNLRWTEGTNRLRVFAAAGEPPKKSEPLGHGEVPERREPEREVPGEGKRPEPLFKPAKVTKHVFKDMGEVRVEAPEVHREQPAVEGSLALKSPSLRDEIVSPKKIVKPLPRFIASELAEFNRKAEELKEKRKKREEFQPEKIDLDVLREEKVLKAELDLLNSQDKVERLSLNLLKIEIKLQKALAAKWWAFGKLRTMFWRWRLKRAGLKKKKIEKVVSHLSKVFELTKKFFKDKFGLKRKEVEREISLTERDFKAISLEVEKRKDSFIQQFVQQVKELRERFSSTSLGERVFIGEKVFNALERKASSLRSTGEIIEFNSKLSVLQQLFNENDFGNGLRVLGEAIGKPFNELQKDFEFERPSVEPSKPVRREAVEAPVREAPVGEEAVAGKKVPPIEWAAEEEEAVDAARRRAEAAAEEREEEEEARRKGIPKGVAPARERVFEVPEKANLAIIKVDLAGYTALSERFGEEHVEQLDTIKNKFQEMVLGHVDKNHGVFYLGEGDAVYALFDSMTDALKTLYSVQGALPEFSKSLRRENRVISERLTDDLSVSSGINAIQVDEATLKKIDSLDAISTHLGPQIQDTIKLQSAARAGQILVNARFSNEFEGAKFREITLRDPKGGGDKHYFLIEATDKPIGEFVEKGKTGGTVRMKLAHAAFGITRQELKHATMLFTSIKNFDSQVQGLPAARREALRQECFRKMEELTSERGGTFVKKMGATGAFITFGADRVTERDIYFATQLSLEMDKAINAIGKRFGETVNLRLGSGINFGRVGITWFGNKPDLGGDRVNVAARFMQGAGEGEILISDRVRRSIKGGEFEVEALGQRKYKGVSAPINIFTVKREVLRNKLDILFGEKATEFVGRSEELSEVEKHVLEHLINAKTAQPVSGKNRFFNVVGDAGLGKSRIRFEAIKRLREQGFDAITSSIPIYGKDKNTAILHGWLRDIFKLTGRESREEAIAEVSRQVKELLTEPISPEYSDEKLVDLRTKIVLDELGFELEEVKDIDPKARVELIQSTLIDLVKARSLKTPLVLGLEDLHYAKDEAVKDRDVMDKRIENFLSKIVDELQGFNVIFWADQRPGITHRFLDEGNRLDLSNLDEATSLDLSKKFLGVIEIPEKVVPHISKAKGVPYFIEQMLGFLRDTKIIQVEGKECKVNLVKLKEMEEKIPGTIQATISQRIDGLLATAKKTIQTASALGREFDANVLKELLDESERTYLDRNLVFLEELGLIKQLPSQNGERPFIFAHDLTQEVAYSMMYEGEKRTPLHEKALQVFENKVMSVEPGLEQDKVYAEVIGDLLHHARFSGNPEQLVHYLIEAGIIAKEGWKNNLAMDYLNEALSLLPETDERQIGVRAYMYEILEAQGKYDEGIQLLHEAWIRLGGTVKELYAEEK